MKRTQSYSLSRRSEARENRSAAGSRMKQTRCSMYLKASDLNRFLVECLCHCYVYLAGQLYLRFQINSLFRNTRTAKCSELLTIQFLCLCPLSLSAKLNLIISTTVYKCYIHFPRGCAAFGQHQESRLLAPFF